MSILPCSHWTHLIGENTTLMPHLSLYENLFMLWKAWYFFNLCFRWCLPQLSHFIKQHQCVIKTTDFTSPLAARVNEKFGQPCSAMTACFTTKKETWDWIQMPLSDVGRFEGTVAIMNPTEFWKHLFCREQSFQKKEQYVQWPFTTSDRLVARMEKLLFVQNLFSLNCFILFIQPTKFS